MTLASVAGAALGYWIGFALYDGVGDPVAGVLRQGRPLRSSSRRCTTSMDAWAVAIGAITPFPYKVTTIVSGLLQMDFASFMGVSLLARGFRFFLIAALLWKFGTPIRVFIERRSRAGDGAVLRRADRRFRGAQICDLAGTVHQCWPRASARRPSPAALYFQYVEGLPPCGLCVWQRYALSVGIAGAVLAAMTSGSARGLFGGLIGVHSDLSRRDGRRGLSHRRRAVLVGGAAGVRRRHRCRPTFDPAAVARRYRNEGTARLQRDPLGSVRAQHGELQCRNCCRDDIVVFSRAASVGLEI